MARDSVVEAGTTMPPTGIPVTSTATTRFAPFVAPNGPPRSWNVTPPWDAPRASCESMTTIDGCASRSATRRTCSCNTATRVAQVPLRDQRRNCDHTRVHGPNDSGR